jgi:ATP-binding cassette subfamily B protein
MDQSDSGKGDSSSKGLISFIWKFIVSQKGSFFWIYFLSLAWSLDATLWPYLLRHIIDTFNQFDSNRALAWPILKILLMAGFALWILVEVAFRLRDFLRASSFSKLEAQIRMAMFEHVQQHSPHYFNEHFAGSLSNKINDMVTQVSSVLLNIMVFLPAFATCALSIIFFAKVSGLFAVILTIWVTLHYAIIFAFTPKCADYSNYHGQARSTLAGKMVDSLTNNFAVNLFFRFRFEKDLIAVDQKVEQETNYQSQRYVALMYSVVSLVFLVGAISLNGFMIYYWLIG